MLFRIIVMLTLTFSLGLPNGHSQEMVQSPVAFNISLNRTDAYLVGEPVIASLHLTNMSDKTVSVQTDPDFEADLRVHVRTPMTRPWTEVKNPFGAVALPSSPFNLLPKETRTFNLILLYDRSNRDLPSNAWPKLVFDQESFFRLKAQLTIRLNGAQQFYIEREVDLEVKAPVQNSPEDLTLGGLLLRVDNDRLVFQTRQMESYQRLKAMDNETRNFFEKVVDELPANRYTPYFLYLLANSYDTARRDEQKKAIVAYERLAREYPSFFFRDGVYAGLAKLYDEAGQSDKAHAMILRMLKDSGPNEEFLNSRLGRDYLTRGMDYDPEYWMLVR